MQTPMQTPNLDIDITPFTESGQTLVTKTSFPIKYLMAKLKAADDNKNVR